MTPRSFAPLPFAALVCFAVLLVPAAGQADYEVVNATVTPDFGYLDFIYSAQLSVMDIEVGDIAISKYKAVLKIYNGSEEIYSETSMDRKIEAGKSLSDSFVFGPYDFESNFGVRETRDASFEFIIYKNGEQIARARKPGPVVEPPRMTGTPQFDASPYFVQGLGVAGSFRDMEGLSPTCALEVTGPLGAPGERTWTTPPLECDSGGSNLYSFEATQDLSEFRDGGRFVFNIIYNNARINPLVEGPYNFTVLPYSVSIDSLEIPKQLDCTNFTIRAEVEDVGMKATRGGRLQGSHAELIVTRPDNTVLRSVIGDGAEGDHVKIDGDYLIFEWDKDLLPFNRSDVELSRHAPFQARLEYTNDNWNYAANASASFSVVEEIPRLIEIEYDPLVYVRPGEETPVDISATVQYSKGMGDMILSMAGPGVETEEAGQGSRLSSSSYTYHWKTAFDERHANNNYTLYMEYRHPSIDGGSYSFDEREVEVIPVRVVFEGARVDPASGHWDGAFNYSVKVNSSVDLALALQVYNPCTSEWESRGSWTKRVSSGSNVANWTVRPFDYDCPEMGSDPAKFRFRARFGDDEFSSRAYSGPVIASGQPRLSSLDYDPVVYVPAGSSSESAVRAAVDYPPGMGRMNLSIEGPGMTLDATDGGADQGNGRYIYEYDLAFNDSHAGHSYDLALVYSHPSIDGGSYSFDEMKIDVVPVYITFENASVSPGIGNLNDQFTYSVDVNSSVEMDLVLQTYDPCREVWAEAGSVQISSGEDRAQWISAPFKKYCDGMDLSALKYRFMGRFGDLEYTSDVYPGPLMYGEEPELITLDYDPVIYVSEGSMERQRIEATVQYPAGMGSLAIAVRGPGMDFEGSEDGAEVGGGRYRYSWSLPFGVENAGNHTISLRYIHPTLEGGEHVFDDAVMSVVVKSDQPDGGTPSFKSDISMNVTQMNGVVNPEGALVNRGILKVSETSTLYPFTYTARIENQSFSERPWVELLVRAPGSTWRSAGEKKQYDPAKGGVSWTLDPFPGLEFVGTAEFKFLINGAESRVFVGPEIIAVYKDLEWNATAVKGMYDYSAWFNSSANLTVDLVSSKDNKRWTAIGMPRDYVTDSGWKRLIWENRPGYDFYDMDVKVRDGAEVRP